jgi:hypothetical protein
LGVKREDLYRKMKERGQKKFEISMNRKLFGV